MVEHLHKSEIVQEHLNLALQRIVKMDRTVQDLSKTLANLEEYVYLCAHLTCGVATAFSAQSGPSFSSLIIHIKCFPTLKRKKNKLSAADSPLHTPLLRTEQTFLSTNAMHRKESYL